METTSTHPYSTIPSHQHHCSPTTPTHPIPGSIFISLFVSTMLQWCIYKWALTIVLWQRTKVLWSYFSDLEASFFIMIELNDSGARTHGECLFVERMLIEQTCKERLLVENHFGRIETKTKGTGTKVVVSKTIICKCHMLKYSFSYKFWFNHKITNKVEVNDIWKLKGYSSANR